MAAVQVAGRGAVSSLGHGLDALLSGIREGRTGLRPRRRLADVESVARFIGEIPFDDPGIVEPATSLPRRLAVAAAREALDDWRSRGGRCNEAMALVLASTKGDLSGIVAPRNANAEGASSSQTGLGCPAFLAREVADALDLGGPVQAVSNACGSGLTAIALASRWVASGRCQNVLVVGVDALCGFILRGFDGLMALDPARCRPYDRGRAGLSLGEGAGSLVLGADPAVSIGVQVRGWGEASDATHITAPHRDGSGLRRACEEALRRAGLGPEDVDLVHLHGTGTNYNDAMELKAMDALFAGRAADRVPAAGTKAQTGHTLGAAGLLESIVVTEALSREECPGNVGLSDPEPCRSLDLRSESHAVPGARVALKVCAGFGGINSALVFSR